MTTEHVSVPRELLQSMRDEMRAFYGSSIRPAWPTLEGWADGIDAILSRATPSEVCDFCGGDCSAANSPVATCPLITQGVDAAIDTMRKVNKEKPSAPRVVTNEDVADGQRAYYDITGEETSAVAMRAALESFATSLPAARVPDGWKLVPLLPTEPMKIAAELYQGTEYVSDPTGDIHRLYVGIYKAMLAAAPDADAEGKGNG